MPVFSSKGSAEVCGVLAAPRWESMLLYNCVKGVLEKGANCSIQFFFINNGKHM